MESQRIGVLANVFTLPPAYFCGYAAWVQLRTPPPALGAAVTAPSLWFVLLFGAFAALTVLGIVVRLIPLFQRPKRPVLKIHYARYGTGTRRGEYKDVTGAVRDHISSDGYSLDMEVSNAALGGDPFKNEHKRLWVAYSINELIVANEARIGIPSRLVISRPAVNRLG